MFTPPPQNADYKSVSNTQNSRTASLDVLKTSAALLVTVIHACVILEPLGDTEVWSATNILTRLAVPIFFMITGYYYPSLVRRGRFWAHIKKLTVITIAAMVFYVIYGYLTSVCLGGSSEWESTEEWKNRVFSLRSVVSLFALGGGSFTAIHLWFLVCSIYDLLIFKAVDHMGLSRLWKYVVPILIVLSCLIMIHGGWPMRLLRSWEFAGLIFIGIGRMVAEKSMPMVDSLFKSPKRCVAIFFIAIALHTCEFIVRGRTFEFSICIYPAALALFYLALQNPTFGSGTLTAKIGKEFSTGIYIFHWAVLQLLGVALGLDAEGYSLPKAIAFLVLGAGLSLLASVLWGRVWGAMRSALAASAK